MRKIRLSIEIPIKHQWEFDQYQDFHFVIAPVIEQFGLNYTNYFKDKGPRNLILDNGYSEQGEIDLTRLINIATALQYQYIIPPEKVNTWMGHLNMCCEIEREGFTPLPVLHDKWRWTNLPPIGLISLPYLTHFNPRTACLQPMIGQWIHYLGLQDLTEFKRNNWQFHSLDTSLPIKAALIGKRIEDIKNHNEVSNLYTNKLDFYKTTLTKEELKLAHLNCQRLQDETRPY